MQRTARRRPQVHVEKQAMAPNPCTATGGNEAGRWPRACHFWRLAGLLWLPGWPLGLFPSWPSASLAGVADGAFGVLSGYKVDFVH